MHARDIPAPRFLLDQALFFGDGLDFFAGHGLAVLLVDFLEPLLALVVVPRLVVEHAMLRDVPEFETESHSQIRY